MVIEDAEFNGCKIAVIFVADAVGFSKMMAINEDQTLRSLRLCREILDNLFEEHGGRIFNPDSG